jgi:sporulation protein YlmC with PRC-barrel domain
MSTTMYATWTPTTHTDYDQLKGKDVYSRDGEKLGSIGAVFHPDLEMPEARGKHYFLLDPGVLREWFGGQQEVYLPESAITEFGDDRVVVGFTKDQVKGQGWTTTPAGFDRIRRV